MRRYISPPDPDRLLDAEERPYAAVERVGEDRTVLDTGAALDLVERTLREEDVDEETKRALRDAERRLSDALSSRAESVADEEEERLREVEE